MTLAELGCMDKGFEGLHAAGGFLRNSAGPRAAARNELPDSVQIYSNSEFFAKFSVFLAGLGF